MFTDLPSKVFTFIAGNVCPLVIVGVLLIEKADKTKNTPKIAMNCFIFIVFYFKEPTIIKIYFKLQKMDSY